MQSGFGRVLEGIVEMRTTFLDEAMEIERPAVTEGTTSWTQDGYAFRAKIPRT